MRSSTNPQKSPHHAELVNADGSWKYTNRLIDQTSPYLLQHAHNPVDWYPWGEEAFEKARREDRPIFLSIGYSTCYWCHVMEREDFENPSIAALMNEHFVSIKVDREERPDIDDIYMTATQIVTQRGGWPMSVFLTPPSSSEPGRPRPRNSSRNDPHRGGSGLEPYFAGTYFPPRAGFGTPSFPQVLQAMSKAWREQREEVLEQAGRIADAVKQAVRQRYEPGDVGVTAVQNAANQLLRLYDREHGGFSGGSGPKFPTPGSLFLLLAVYHDNPTDALAHAITHTLDRMASGGMYDQIGGGFHRYSVDEKWLVPHFEKMLYDNGQLVELYVEASEAMPAACGLARRVIRESCDYVSREMTDDAAGGAFWSAQDAEVNGREGGNYVWTREQVEQTIDDPALAALAVKMYGLDRGANFRDPHAPDAPPTNVLYLPQPLDELARETGMEVEALMEARTRINAALKAVRDQRDQPRTDDKVLVAWNGLMIAGLAMAGRVLEEPRYIAAAARAAHAILDHMTDGDAGLYRAMRRGEAKIPAFLEDYACFVHGLIELHRSSSLPSPREGLGEGSTPPSPREGLGEGFTPPSPREGLGEGIDEGDDHSWLDLAQKYTQAAIDRFADRAGGYFDTLENQSDLFVRTRSFHDGAMPSGNSRMLHNLLDLYELTAEAPFLDRAVSDLRAFAQPLSEHGANMAFMQAALLRAIELAPDRFAGRDMARASASPSGHDPVTVRVEPKAVDLANGSAQVSVILEIAPTYHLNAHDIGTEEALIPTTVELGDDGRGLTIDVAYPPPVEKKFDFADHSLAVYEGAVTFPVTIRQIAEAPSDAVTLIVSYQACTDVACLEPGRLELGVRVKS